MWLVSGLYLATAVGQPMMAARGQFRREADLSRRVAIVLAAALAPWRRRSVGSSRRA
ncbi:hypothetical protein [Burkholderia thailandensis]|uniref:hypothetical protein n=1 Tax=Burkholderia thailandensis TaxID=57975 RepID=UPI00187D45B0|nr:hypothetical protein [Burkholderia thailandensis]